MGKGAVTWQCDMTDAHVFDSVACFDVQTCTHFFYSRFDMKHSPRAVALSHTMAQAEAEAEAEARRLQRRAALANVLPTAFYGKCAFQRLHGCNSRKQCHSRDLFFVLETPKLDGGLSSVGQANSAKFLTMS